METSSKNAEPLIVERSYEASVTKVWEALTDVDKMRQWYFNIADFKAEPGFEFEFTAGDDTVAYVHKCVIKEVIPNKKLSYTWCYADYKGDSLVTFELFEKANGGTSVRITHTGLETFPDLPSFARSSFNGGWEHILGVSLKNFVEKS